ncbi:Phosphatidylinositol-4-phosphate 5-kinase, partial [Globisporangium splendens]
MATADPFLKSPLNPVNMSRSAAHQTSGHAPSTRILRRVREAATDLAHLAATPHGWKFVADKNDAMLYEMNGRALPASVSTVHTFGAGGGNVADFYLVRGVTTLYGSDEHGIRDVLAFLAARTTEEFAPKMKRVFGKYYANGVVIDKLSCTTPPPFAPVADSEDEDGGAKTRRKSFSDDDAYSVNWLSLTAPTSLGGVDKNRDFTMVSYQDAFERHENQMLRVGKGAVMDDQLALGSSRIITNNNSSNSGKMMLGVHVLMSVNFKDIPALPKSANSNRQHFRNSGFVVEATSDPHKFRLSMFLSLLPTKSSLKNARKYQKWLLSVVSSVGNLARVVSTASTLQHDGTLLLSRSKVGKTAWKKSDHCYLCLKMFRTFRRCHHCRLCGEAVCSTCSGFVKLPGAMGTRARRNSGSSVDIRSQYSHDGDSSSDESSYASETRGCNVCIESVIQSTSVSGNAMGGSLSRSASMSSSSFSSSSHMTLATPQPQPQTMTATTQNAVGVGSTSVHSNASMVRSDDESMISFGDDTSDRGSGTVGSSSSNNALNQPFQAYYNSQRTRSTDDQSDNFHAAAPGPPMKPYEYNAHHNMLNNPSMSTTSSSFSRTSHESEQLVNMYALQQHQTNQDVYQYQQHPYEFQQRLPPRQYSTESFSSEVSYGDDDLSMDPDILALAGLTLKDKSSNHKQYYKQQPPVYSVDENEDYDDFDFSGSQRGTAATTATSGWSAADSMISTTSNSSSSSRGTSTTSGATFHFSTMSSSGAAPATSSVHQEIAVLMLQDLATPNQNTNNLGSSRGPSAETGAASLGRPPMSAAMRSTGTSSGAANAGFTPSQSAYNLLSSMNRSGGFSNTNSHLSSSPKIISASSQHASSSSSSSRANDMILLPVAPPKSPEFVEFSDATRESIFVRPDDGNDMIRLNF